jgi:hypothetical protein
MTAVRTARSATVMLAALTLVASAGGAASPKVPTGVFRTTITDADLSAGGVSDLFENHGTYTLRLLPNGRWRFHQVASPPPGSPNHAGRYGARGNAVRFTDPASHVGFTARVSFDGRHLRFKILRADIRELRVIFGAHPWTKLQS